MIIFKIFRNIFIISYPIYNYQKKKVISPPKYFFFKIGNKKGGGGIESTHQF